MEIPVFNTDSVALCGVRSGSALFADVPDKTIRKHFDPGVHYC